MTFRGCFVTPNVFGLAPTHGTCRTEGNVRDLSGHVGRLFQRQAAGALTGLYCCDIIAAGKYVN